jgi:hypothetical protein
MAAVKLTGEPDRRERAAAAAKRNSSLTSEEPRTAKSEPKKVKSAELDAASAPTQQRMIRSLKERRV